MQTWASVEHGMWYARSAEFTKTSLMDTLRWMRMIGDTIFAIGVLALAWFVFWLKGGWSVLRQTADPVLESKRIATQHVPVGKDGTRVTARSKGKVERPLRTVKEASRVHSSMNMTQLVCDNPAKCAFSASQELLV